MRMKYLFFHALLIIVFSFGSAGPAVDPTKPPTKGTPNKPVTNDATKQITKAPHEHNHTTENSVDVWLRTKVHNTQRIPAPHQHVFRSKCNCVHSYFARTPQEMISAFLGNGQHHARPRKFRDTGPGEKQAEERNMMVTVRAPYINLKKLFGIKEETTHHSIIFYVPELKNYKFPTKLSETTTTKKPPGTAQKPPGTTKRPPATTHKPSQTTEPEESK